MDVVNAYHPFGESASGSGTMWHDAQGGEASRSRGESWPDVGAAASDSGLRIEPGL